MRTSPQLRLLRNRSFGALWTAGLISMTGDWLLGVALPIYVYQLSHSAAATATAVAARVIASLVVSPLAGVYVDRWDRKRVMIYANLVQALVILPLVAVTSADRLWLAYVVIAAQAVAAMFVAPAEHSLLPRLVDESDLPTANGLNGLNNNLARLVGPALGGVVAATLGLSGAVLLDSLSFLLAAVLSGLIVGAHRAASNGAQRHLLRELGEGVHVIVKSRMLRALFAVIAIISIGEGIMSSLFPVFVSDALHGGVRQMGWLMSSQAVGGIVGGLLSGAVARRLAAPRLLVVGVLLFGALDLALFNYPRWTDSFSPAVVLLVLVGIPGALATVAWFTLLQLEVPDALRARTLSVVIVLESAGMLAGAALAGGLTGHFGVINVLTGQGLGYVFAGLAFALLVRGVQVRTIQPRPSDKPGLVEVG
jgi:MFS family permease